MIFYFAEIQQVAFIYYFLILKQRNPNYEYWQSN
jgi:hypothetical protein